MPELTSGIKIEGRYEIVEQIGDGTLGEVYRALDTAAGRTVVVKLLSTKLRADPDLVKRFIAHYRAQQSRNHDGLVRVLDLGISDSRPYVVFEQLEGLSLRQLLAARVEEGSQFSLDEARSIAEEVGQILSFIHQSGFHGAVKPENIFLLPDRLKVTDDGLSEIVTPEIFARVQVADAGSAPYCAPEFLSDPENTGIEADVFGLAAIVHELLTGEAPTVEGVGLEAIAPQLPEGAVAIIRKGMADNPTDRHPTVNTFLLDLARLGSDKEKIGVLEAVVEAEAMAAAQEEVSRVKQENVTPPETDRSPVPNEKEEPLELESTESEDRDVAHLFVDDEVPETLPEMAIADVHNNASPDRSDQRNEDIGDSTDLLSPTSTISAAGRSNGSRIAAILIVLLALGGAGVWFANRPSAPVTAPGDSTALPRDKQTATVTNNKDSRLQQVVAKLVLDSETYKSEYEQIDGAVTTSEDYQNAVGVLADAGSALRQKDFATAMELAQIASAGFKGLIQQAQQDSEIAKEEALAKAKAKSVANEKKSKKDISVPPKGVKKTKAIKKAVVVKAKKIACAKNMVRIKAGPFMAGSPTDDLLRDPTERPLGEESVAEFCIDKYEFPNKKNAKPKTRLSQKKAERVCAEHGKRLCSELEWEKVCKGPRSNPFPYGKVWDPNACNTETASGEDRSVAPTGKFNQCKSDYGVYDLSGNVLEWTGSRFEQDRKLAIAKGGSYMRPDYAARCAYRYTAPSATVDVEIGFRCCMTPQ